MSNHTDRHRENEPKTNDNTSRRPQHPFFPPSAVRSGVGDGRGRPRGLVGGGAGTWLLLRRHLPAAGRSEDDPQGKPVDGGFQAGLLWLLLFFLL